MKNFRLETSCGNRFENVANLASELAKEKHIVVEFEFNGVLCIVDENTNTDWLYRDYCNAHLMEWKSVGAYCVAEYAPKIKTELAKREKKSEERQRKQQKEYDRKAQKEQDTFNKKVAGINIELSNPESWNEYREKNKDPYGKCCVDYAENWAKLMQVEMAKGKTVVGCADKTSHELGFMGITGFMYGCAVSMLSSCWRYGEELRKWHNKEYGHEGEGVVNPAILTLKA